MRIAPGIEVVDWKSLDLSKPDNPDWGRAISIFDRRIRGRFTDVAEFLIADDEKRGLADRRFGFAILSIDCLVVETLQAFREGLTDTRGESERLCTTFLSQRPAFKSFFIDDLASRFYREFRCGIVHNAQVFGTGLVWSVGPLLMRHGTKLTVNRTAFHAALIRELESYLAELGDQGNATLRDNFRTKMDFIADASFQPEKRQRRGARRRRRRAAASRRSRP